LKYKCEGVKMKKIRLIRTQIIEYVPNPEHYPEGSSIEDMARIDAENDDVDLTFAECDNEVVTYEIIED